MEDRPSEAGFMYVYQLPEKITPDNNAYPYLLASILEGKSELPKSPLVLASDPLRYLASAPGAAEYRRLPKVSTETSPPWVWLATPQVPTIKN